jgi:hypothetical protein
MKHRLVAPNDNGPPQPEMKPIKLPLASGDMILMQGKTSSKLATLHTKRFGKNAEDGEASTLHSGEQ